MIASKTDLAERVVNALLTSWIFPHVQYVVMAVSDAVCVFRAECLANNLLTLPGVLEVTVLPRVGTCPYVWIVMDGYNVTEVSKLSMGVGFDYITRDRGDPWLAGWEPSDAPRSITRKRQP